MIDGYDAQGLAFATAVAAIPALMALRLGLRPLGPLVDTWARARGVPLTDETRPFVAARLTAARRWRTTGFAIGWVVPYVELWITRSAHETNPLAGWFVPGYLLGALGAELWAAHATRPSGAAALAPRDLHRYLPEGALLWARLAALASMWLVPLYVVVPRSDIAPPVRELATTALLGLVLLLAVELLPRLVVRPRQAFLSPDLLRADDAMRSWSAHAVTGVLLAMLLFGLARQVGAFARIDTDLASVTAIPAILGLAAMVYGLRAFLLLSSYEWRWRVPPDARADPA